MLENYFHSTSCGGKTSDIFIIIGANVQLEPVDELALNINCEKRQYVDIHNNQKELAYDSIIDDSCLRWCFTASTASCRHESDELQVYWGRNSCASEIIFEPADVLLARSLLMSTLLFSQMIVLVGLLAFASKH